MVLIVHLDKSILFLDYKNILISITSLQQKISMKKKFSTEQFLFIMADDFCASLVHSSKTSTNKQKMRKKKKKKVISSGSKSCELGSIGSHIVLSVISYV